MSVTEIVLDQLNPATPKCGRRNNYNGVVIVQAVEATATAAKRAAYERAKTVAGNALSIIRTGRICPPGCGANPTYDGDVNPKVQPLAQVVPLEDPGRSKWVAYAWAHWRRAAKCPGKPEPQDQWQAGSETKVLRYAEGGPACGTTRLFTGCVLARTYDDKQSDAKTKARQAAIDFAVQGPPAPAGSPPGQGPLIEDRSRQCPQSCQPGQSVGTDPAALAPVDLLDVPVFQWVSEPYVAYAFVTWAVTVTCPPPPPPPPEDEGGGGGEGGGLFYSRTKRSVRKASVARKPGKKAGKASKAGASKVSKKPRRRPSSVTSSASSRKRSASSPKRSTSPSKRSTSSSKRVTHSTKRSPSTAKRSTRSTKRGAGPTRRGRG